MSLHHLLTIALFLGAYLTNDIETGIIVSYLMDICDVPVHYAKAFVDTTFKTTCTVLGVLMWSAWGWTRLYCLPFHIYYSFFLNPSLPPHNMSGTYQAYTLAFEGSLLTILFIMGIWWWYLISKMVFTAITKGKNKDI